MKISVLCETVGSVFVVLLLCVLSGAQTPTGGIGDPGPLVIDPATGISVPVGYSVTEILDLTGLIPGDAFWMTTGPGGDLFVNGVASPSSPVHIFRVAMLGDVPVQPVSVSQYTTVPIEAHIVAHDPVTDDLWATSSAGLSNEVYRIPTSGIPLVQFGSLFDPCDLSIGTPSWATSPHLWIATQGGLLQVDLGAAPLAAVNVSVDLSLVPAAGLGNWGGMTFDPSTDELIGGFIGFPSTSNTVAMPIAAGVGTSVATLAAPNGSIPRGLDPDGSRLFTSPMTLGFVNAAPLTHVTILAGGTIRATARAPGGGLFVLVGNHVYRLERTLRIDRLSVPATTGALVGFEVTAGLTHASSLYRMFLTSSGSTPGVTVGSLLFPINPDPITLLVDDAVTGGHPGLAAWAGSLDANGGATATLPVPALVPGLRFNVFAFLFGALKPTNCVWFHVE